MSSRKNLVMLYGGRSGEHEISLLSAASVLRNLDARLYNIIPIGMDKKGCFFLNDYQELLTYSDCLPVKTENSKSISSLIVDGKFVIDDAVVMPIVHGPLYEDGCLQGLLELANVAYIGCNVVASAVAMDKEMTKAVFKNSDNFKMARYQILHCRHIPKDIEKICAQIIDDLGLPVFVKPNMLGSSVGIHKAKNISELINAIKDASKYDETVLIEEAIIGREIEFAVLENPENILNPIVSVAGEIKVRHRDEFYSYTAKYLESDQTDLIIPADLSAEMLDKFQKVAADIFVRLKCSGLARIDFFLKTDTQEIYFNEANTIPGFTTISMYPKLLEHSGISYKDLLNRLIEIAIIRKKYRNQLVTDYK